VRSPVPERPPVGYARSPIADVRVADCTFDGVANPDILQNVKNLTFTNVRVNGKLV